MISSLYDKTRLIRKHIYFQPALRGTLVIEEMLTLAPEVGRSIYNPTPPPYGWGFWDISVLTGRNLLRDNLWMRVLGYFCFDR